MDITARDYAPQNYTASISLLTELIKEQQPALLAGTSMGGYYALKLAELTGIPCLAVNACFEPALSLSKYLQQPAEDYANGGFISFHTGDAARVYPAECSRSAGQHHYWSAGRKYSGRLSAGIL